MKLLECPKPENEKEEDNVVKTSKQLENDSWDNLFDENGDFKLKNEVKIKFEFFFFFIFKYVNKSF